MATPLDQPAAAVTTPPAVDPTTPAPSTPSTPWTAWTTSRVRRRLGRWARRHALFGVLAAVALAARALVVVTYQPALMYLGDSGAYLDQAWHGLWPEDWRPSGYPMFLRLVDGEAHLTRLVIIQHALTFAVGVVLYALAARVTRRTWLAALCAVPVLLSPWVLDLGQFVLAETLFSALTGLGLLLVALPGRPRAWAAALAGLLLGASLTVRTVGYGPLAVAFAVLLVTAVAAGVRSRRDHDVGVVRTALRVLAVVFSFAVAAAAPICAYSGWSLSEGRHFNVSAHSGYFLYGRVAPFADCSLVPRDDPGLRSLCDPRPVAERTQPDTYLWPATSLLRQGHARIPKGREELAGEFANAVVNAEPWTIVRTSGDYLVGYFSPTRYETSKTSRADTWELPDTLTNVLPASDPRSADGYYIVTTMRAGPAEWLAGYSRLGYAPMPLVGAGLVAGLLAVPVARLRSRPGPPPLYWLTGGGGLSVLAISALTAGFDYRYLTSVIGILGAGAVLGAVSLLRVLRRAPAQPAPRQPTPGPGTVAETVPSPAGAAASTPASPVAMQVEAAASAPARDPAGPRPETASGPVSAPVRCPPPVRRPLAAG